jgi:hypothetical protein
VSQGPEPEGREKEVVKALTILLAAGLVIELALPCATPLRISEGSRRKGVDFVLLEPINSVLGWRPSYFTRSDIYI